MHSYNNTFTFVQNFHSTCCTSLPMERNVKHAICCNHTHTHTLVYLYTHRFQCKHACVFCHSISRYEVLRMCVRVYVCLPSSPCMYAVTTTEISQLFPLPLHFVMASSLIFCVNSNLISCRYVKSRTIP